MLDGFQICAVRVMRMAMAMYKSKHATVVTSCIAI